MVKSISYSCYDLSLFLSSQYSSSLGNQKYIHLYTICNFLFAQKSCANNLKNSYVPSTKIHPIFNILPHLLLCFVSCMLPTCCSLSVCLLCMHECNYLFLNAPVMSLTVFSSLSTISHLAFSYQDN